MNVVDRSRLAFTEALRNGDAVAAEVVIEQAVAADVSPVDIYLRIFAPSMVAIGSLWERNELSVAEEHLATAITERLIHRLSGAFADDQPSHGRVVLGCVAGERHVLGPRMLADLLRQEGWQVLYLGADVPTLDWVQLAIRYTPNVVAISASHASRIPATQELIAELRSVLPGLHILVGGAVFDQQPALWHTVGADLYNRDPVLAVKSIPTPAALRPVAATP